MKASADLLREASNSSIRSFPESKVPAIQSTRDPRRFASSISTLGSCISELCERKGAESNRKESDRNLCPSIIIPAPGSSLSDTKPIL